MRALVGSHSQVHRLRGELMVAGVSHDSAIRADLAPVRLDAEGMVFFCDIQSLGVNKVLRQGDGGKLPVTASVSPRLEFPRGGYFYVADAIITANGRMRITADEKTQVVSLNPPDSGLQGMDRVLSQEAV